MHERGHEAGRSPLPPAQRPAGGGGDAPAPTPMRGLTPRHTGHARELSWGQRPNLGSFVIPSHKSVLLLPKPRVMVGEGSHWLLVSTSQPRPSFASEISTTCSEHEQGGPPPRQL